MKELFHAFVMCQSMFSAIPCPIKVWDENARGKMLLFLPLIGLEIGFLWYLAALLCSRFDVSPLIRGFIFTVIPFVVSGFIHLDGFMDVSDAIGSYMPVEKRREILKDSHVGSFAVIKCVLLMLGMFAVCSSFKNVDFRVLIFIPTVSRCLSSVFVSVLPKMETSQYSKTKKDKLQTVFAVLVSVLCIGFGFYVTGVYAIALIGGLCGYLIALVRAYVILKGMNGDISGYSIVCSEFSSLFVLFVLGEIL